MALRNFLVDIDLNKNQLKNARLQNLNVRPGLTAGDAGFIFWNYGTNTAEFWTGTTWKSLEEQVQLSGDIITITGGVATIQPNVVDNLKLSDMPSMTIKGNNTAGINHPKDLIKSEVLTMLNISDGAQVNVGTNLGNTPTSTTVTLSSSTGIGTTIPAPVDNVSAGVMTGAQSFKLTGIATNADVTATSNVTSAGAVMKTQYNTSTILVADVDDSPTPLTVGTNTVVGRVNGTIQAISIDADLSSVSTTDDTIPSAKAVKGYVDGVVTGALIYQGGYDANTNTPLLDVTPSALIKKGWTYVVTVAGVFFTTPVAIGDLVISEKDAPILETDWTSVNKNIPDILASTETVQGIVELASQSEVIAGVDSTRAISPAHLLDITKLGIIGTGTWQGTIISSTYGGTGINNAGRTLTINNNNGTLVFTSATPAAQVLTVTGTASIIGTNTGDQTTITGNSGSASTLQTSQNFSITGDVAAASISFNGSSPVVLNAVLPNITTTGTYKSVTVNAKGQVTAGTNPTTRAGFGITDAVGKFSMTVTGDGSLVTWTIPHNLNTLDVEVYVKEASTLMRVEVEEVISTVNNVIVNFNTAPSAGKQYIVVVMG